MNYESLRDIYPSTEIEVIELKNQCVTKPQVFEVYYYNNGDTVDQVLDVPKEDFENWFTGSYGIEGSRDEFFSTYYSDTKTFQDDMLFFLLETKRDGEAFSQEAEIRNLDSIFNSIARITQPEIAA